MIERSNDSDLYDYDEPYTAEEFKRVMDERHPGILQREYRDPRWFRYFVGIAPLVTGIFGLTMTFILTYSDEAERWSFRGIFGALLLFGLFCVYKVRKDG